MAAWNVTICSSASSMFKMNSKSRVEQVLGMVPSPQVSPSTIRGGVGEHCSGDVNAQWATKRGYYAAFAEQMGDEEMEVEEEIVGGAGGVLLKKRRLTMDQVRFLESNFESENKLEPERKVQIAQRLGLQPRQVAVWFQNRRARSKTKQLERDFLAMKANYHAVQLENEKLQAEVERLTALLREGATAADHGVAEGVHGRHNETQLLTLTKVSTKTSGSSSSSYPNLQSENHAEGPATLAMQANARAEEISTASVDNEVGEEEEQLQQPCTILADVNVNVNVSASMVPRPSGATVRTVVGDSASADDAPLCLSEDFYFLSNIMQQGCAHQFVDGYADSFHHDNSFFFTAFDDPWDDS